MARAEFFDYGEHILPVMFVRKEKLHPFFGRACGSVADPHQCFAMVREDLHPLVKRFVISHELYHLVDTHTWWGNRGREIRANFVPAFCDPIGFAACVLATLLSWDRCKLYAHRFWVGY